MRRTCCPIASAVLRRHRSSKPCSTCADHDLPHAAPTGSVRRSDLGFSLAQTGSSLPQSGLFLKTWPLLQGQIPRAHPVRTGSVAVAQAERDTRASRCAGRGNGTFARCEAGSDWGAALQTTEAATASAGRPDLLGLYRIAAFGRPTGFRRRRCPEARRVLAGWRCRPPPSPTGRSRRPSRRAGW